MGSLAHCTTTVTRGSEREKSSLAAIALSITHTFAISGKAEGLLFEDDGDGYEYSEGGYLLTTYVAELQSSVVTVRISKTEGKWRRPNRRLHVRILLGKGAMVCFLLPHIY